MDGVGCGRRANVVAAPAFSREGLADPVQCGESCTPILGDPGSRIGTETRGCSPQRPEILREFRVMTTPPPGDLASKFGRRTISGSWFPV